MFIGDHEVNSLKFSTEEVRWSAKFPRYLCAYNSSGLIESHIKAAVSLPSPFSSVMMPESFEVLWDSVSVTMHPYHH